MDELAIKALVLSHVRMAKSPGRRPLVAPEFSLGSSGVRADLAILADEFIGVEIKSANDSLKRLSAQLQAYSSYFEQVIAVVAERHLSKMSNLDLHGAAVWALSEDGSIRLEKEAAQTRPINPCRLRDLMTQAEQRRLGVTGDKLPTDLREAFADTFKRRYGSTSSLFWSSVGRRKIRVADLSQLSRFSEIRTKQSQNRQARTHFWENWAAQFEPVYT